MRRLLVLLALVVLPAGLALAQKNTVANTVHDITKHTGVGIEKTTIVCTNCHTPHKTNATAPLLWARSYATTSTFNKYAGTTTVTTVDITKPTVTADPMWNSYLCMSCHDNAGSVSDAYLGTTGLTYHFGTDTKFAQTTLQTDHPVNFQYTGLPAADYNAAAGGKVGVLPVYSGNSKTDTVQCSTCHNVHATNYAFDPATPPSSGRTYFLRTSTNICLECHK